MRGEAPGQNHRVLNLVSHLNRAVKPTGGAKPMALRRVPEQATAAA
jgi:hypothetical protein